MNLDLKATFNSLKEIQKKEKQAKRGIFIATFNSLKEIPTHTSCG